MNRIICLLFFIFIFQCQTSKVNTPKEKVKREELESKTSPQRGASSPIMTIVEFSDFNCPYCLSAYVDLKNFVNDNKDSVKLIYRYDAELMLSVNENKK